VFGDDLLQPSESPSESVEVLDEVVEQVVVLPAAGRGIVTELAELDVVLAVAAAFVLLAWREA
jgi:hypothetical protein